MVKKRKSKRVVNKTFSATTFAVVSAIGSILVVQGALAVFPMVVGIVSIVLGFILLSLIFYFQLNKSGRRKI